MKRIIVTGGSRGIGAECVRLFACRGDRVAFIYRSSREAADLIEKETGAKGFCGDVSDPESCRRAVADALEYLGNADVLINSAGIARFSQFQDITEEMWREMIETDLGGVYRVVRDVIPGMISQKCGAVVNISSMWGEVGASCEVHYSAAKAGVIGMTKALAKELAPSGITVNCVSPGAIDTEMNAALGEDVLREIAEETPLGRLGTAREVAEAAAFLADASFITGQVLGVNGGLVI